MYGCKYTYNAIYVFLCIAKCILGVPFYSKWIIDSPNLLSTFSVESESISHRL